MRTLLRTLLVVAVLAVVAASASAWVWPNPDHPAPWYHLDYYYQYKNTGTALEWVAVEDPHDWGPPEWRAPDASGPYPDLWSIWVPNYKWDRSKYIWWENVYPINTPLPQLPDMDPRILIVEDPDNGCTNSGGGVNYEENMYDLTWMTILPIQPPWEIIYVPDPEWVNLYDSEYATPIDWIDLGTWCPEPATLSLIGLGLGGVLLRRRRR